MYLYNYTHTECEILPLCLRHFMLQLYDYSSHDFMTVKTKHLTFVWLNSISDNVVFHSKESDAETFSYMKNKCTFTYTLYIYSICSIPLKLFKKLTKLCYISLKNKLMNYLHIYRQDVNPIIMEGVRP